MPTSGSTDFTVTRDQLISGALRLVGAIGQGESPTAEQVSEAAEALNMLVKAWQPDGLPLWALKQYTMALTASTSSYTIGVGQTINTPKPLRISQAFLTETSSGNSIPMTPLTRYNYNILGNKTSTGNPIQYFYEPLSTYGVLHLFPVPDATAASTYTLTLVYQRPFEDFDSSTDTPDFPPEWFNALKFGLADMLAPEYGVSLEDKRDLRMQAKEAKDLALSGGTEEGSFYFQRDIQRW